MRPFIHLAEAEEMTSGSIIEVIAQNMNAAESGAFTGEISAGMLQSIGVKKVILGHSSVVLFIMNRTKV